jgi:hypothetical protein
MISVQLMIVKEPFSLKPEPGMKILKSYSVQFRLSNIFKLAFLVMIQV